MFEDMAAGLNAKRSVDRLASRLGMADGLDTRLLRFDLLEVPIPLDHASRMDVIILSVKGRKALSPVVEEWLRRWSDDHEDRPYALGVLLGSDQVGHPGDYSLISFIKKIAAEAGTDFFCGASERSMTAADAYLNAVRQRAKNSNGLFERIANPAFDEKSSHAHEDERK